MCLKKLTCKHNIQLETLSGIKQLMLHVKVNRVENVTVNMGRPSLCNVQQVATTDGNLWNRKFVVNGTNYYGTFVCMGNPHLVIFVDNVESVPLADIGSILENHPLFPQKRMWNLLN